MPRLRVLTTAGATVAAAAREGSRCRSVVGSCPSPSWWCSPDAPPRARRRPARRATSPAATGRRRPAASRTAASATGATSGSGSPTAAVLARAVVVLDPGHDGGNAAAPAAVNRLVDIGTGRKACDTAGTETAAGTPSTPSPGTRPAARRATACRRRRRRPDPGRRRRGRPVHHRARRDRQPGRREAPPGTPVVALSLHADGGPPGGLRLPRHRAAARRPATRPSSNRRGGSAPPSATPSGAAPASRSRPTPARTG